MRFLRDPKNLRYRLNIIVPVLVFLTSILSAIAITRIGDDTFWVVGVSLFSALCSFFVAMAMTAPLTELVRKAEEVVRYRRKKTDRGQMIEVYQIIERLIDAVKTKNYSGIEGEPEVIEGIEKLDYLLPLGYMSLMVAHEVRNPLSTIMGMSELLKGKLTEEKHKEYVHVMLDAAKRIDVFTKQLLDFTDDTISEDRVDINKIIGEALYGLTVNYRKIDYRFRKNDIPEFCGDTTKIYQAIHNILKNASEYEQDGGTVSIETEKVNTILFVRINNPHSTIAEEDYHNIFRPFFTRKKGGRGIGLFVSMKNIRSHGGDIVVESGNEGATFIITIPMKELKQ